MQNLFGFIITPLELGLVWLAVTVGSAGIGIILFTIFVRLVLSPLQIVQLRNAKAMQRLQPLMADIKQKHGKDREAQSKAMMELYREHNVNPAMGCLPTLLQFPILIGLFYALLHLGVSPDHWPHTTAADFLKSSCDGIHPRNLHQWINACYSIKNATGTPRHVFDLFHANFLWLNKGLGSPDPYYILPVLAGITQWVQSRMMLVRSTDAQQQMMNTMTNFFPLMIVFFALRYPSGLSLYWVTSTLIGIAIQFRITGWGLLREQLAKPIAILTGGWRRGDSGIGQPRSSGGTARQSLRKPEPKRSIPTETVNPVLDADSTNGELNGDKPKQAAPVRPQRKKANRARGGRGSGRRG